jgi:hypothetical protein
VPKVVQGGGETIIPFLAEAYLGWHFAGIAADVKPIRPVA